MTISVESTGSLSSMARALGLIYELKTLDAVWTAWARVDSPTGEMVQELTTVVDGIERAFGELGEVAAGLEPVFARHAEALREPDALVRTVPEAQRAKARALLAGKGDAAEAVRSAASGMSETGSAEVAKIRAEVDRIARGSSSDGDYSTETEAELALIALGISALAGPGASAIFETVAHTSVGQQIGEAISSAASAVWDFFFG